MTIPNPELFAPEVLGNTGPAPTSGYLVTNHLNLMFMLSAGLILPPSGMGSKYYQDTLGCYSGWIPLFVDRVFDDAVVASVHEARHLRPCMAEIRLSGLAGPVQVLRGNEIVPIAFPSGIDGTEQILFVPAPLPTAWIERILFQSKEDLSACNAEVKDYNNVPWQDFDRKSLKTPFTKALTEPWPPKSGLPDRTTPITVPLAVGGSIAMLLQFANISDFGVQVCRLASTSDVRQEKAVADSVLVDFGPWSRTGRAPLEANDVELSSDSAGANRLQQQLFWNIVGRVADWRSHGQSAEDVVLSCLDECSRELRHATLKAKVASLKEDLEELTGLGSLTPADMFDQYSMPFSRALTLLFLRQTCGELLEFRNSCLTDVDWLSAALLFGVRAGWQELPLALRNLPGLANMVSHRMAVIAHHQSQTGLTLEDPPPRCQPLRELFMGDWNRQQKEAARILVKRQGWNCFQTTIHLADGQYELRGTRGGVKIRFEGEPKSTTVEVDPTRFFLDMGKDRVATRTEKEVRKILDRMNKTPEFVN